jgi:hypothetical protein
MKKIDKLLISVIIFCGVFTAMYLLTPYFRSNYGEATLADTLGINNPMPDVQIEVPECQPEVEPEFPPIVVTPPAVAVYSIKNNKAVRIGNLINRSFNCFKLKEFKIESVKYYLIQVAEPGYKTDKWIVHADDVIPLDACSSIL